MKIKLNQLARAASLASVVAALWTTTAQAVYLNPQGLGQALVYPYYTVNGGQDTLFTLTNQGRDAKAVKVRFLEGYNSRDVLDINVYLAVGDVWTAAVVNDGDGAKLITSDTSCTVPDVAGSPTHSIAFKTSAFDGSTAQGKDGGPTGLTRVREGHIEVVEMGTVTGISESELSPLRGDANMPNQPGGAPISCAYISAGWASGGRWIQDSKIDLLPPSGGLTGSAMIVNVARGTVMAYGADALDNFHVFGKGLEHTPPDALTPNLASATSLYGVVYGGSSEPWARTFARGIDAVTAVFMAGTVSNEFWTSPELGANSEWVITFPTRRFYTDPYYVGTSAAPPFQTVFPAAAGACKPVFGIAVHSADAARAGNLHAVDWFGEPALDIDVPGTLCYATQVVTFNQKISDDDIVDFTPAPPSRVLASNLVAANMPFGFGSGWARIGFSMKGQGQMSSGDMMPIMGQPVTGFLAAQFVNGSIEGALANYTLALRHRTDARCEGDAAQALCLP